MATITPQPASEQQLGSKPPLGLPAKKSLADNIIHMLENGVAPWQKSWYSGAANMPMNPTSERAYRGGNAIHLMATALQKGYQDPRWMTYKQASDNGWQVRRGEKGTQIEFWDVRRGKDNAEARSGQRHGDARTDRASGNDRPRISIHRVYTVFNAAQIDGIPAYAPRQHTSFEVAESGEQILTASGAKIAHDRAERAFYIEPGQHPPATQRGVQRRSGILRNRSS